MMFPEMSFVQFLPLFGCSGVASSLIWFAWWRSVGVSGMKGDVFFFLGGGGRRHSYVF